MLAASVSITESSWGDVEAALMIPTVKTDVGTQHLTKYVQNLKDEEPVETMAPSTEDRGPCVQT